jgi:hypothetical protein
VLIAIIAFNVVAYLQAYRMTHFVAGGERTKGPGDLSILEKANVLLTGVRVVRPECQRTPAAVGLAVTVHRFVSLDGTPTRLAARRSLCVVRSTPT